MSTFMNNPDFPISSRNLKVAQSQTALVLKLQFGDESYHKLREEIRQAGI